MSFSFLRTLSVLTVNGPSSSNGRSFTQVLVSGGRPDDQSHERHLKLIAEATVLDVVSKEALKECLAIN